MIIKKYTAKTEEDAVNAAKKDSTSSPTLQSNGSLNVLRLEQRKV